MIDLVDHADPLREGTVHDLHAVPHLVGDLQRLPHLVRGRDATEDAVDLFPGEQIVERPDSIPGPPGGVAANLNARLSATGTLPGSRTSQAILVNGLVASA